MININNKGRIGMFDRIRNLFGFNTEEAPRIDEFCGSVTMSTIETHQELELNGFLGHLASLAGLTIAVLFRIAGMSTSDINYIRPYLTSDLAEIEGLFGKIATYSKGLVSKGLVGLTDSNIIVTAAAMFNIAKSRVKAALPKLMEYFSYKLKVNVGTMRVLVLDEKALLKAGFARDPFDGFMWILNPSWISRVANALLLVDPKLSLSDASRIARTNAIQFLAGRDRNGHSGILKGLSIIMHNLRDANKMARVLSAALPKGVDFSNIDAIAGPGTLKLGEGCGVYTVDFWLRQCMSLSRDAKVSNQLMRLRLDPESKRLVVESVSSKVAMLGDYKSWRKLVNISNRVDDNKYGTLEKVKAGLHVKTEDLSPLIKGSIEKCKSIEGFSAPVTPGIGILDNGAMFVLRPGECVVPRSSGLKIGDHILLGRSPIMDSAGFTNHTVVAVWNREVVAVSDLRWSLNDGDYDGDRAIVFTNLKVTGWNKCLVKPSKVSACDDLDDDAWRRLVIIEQTLRKALDVRQSSYNHSQAQILLSDIVDVDLIHVCYGQDEKNAVDIKALSHGSAIDPEVCLATLIAQVDKLVAYKINQRMKLMNRMPSLLSMKGNVAINDHIQVENEDEVDGVIDSLCSKERAIEFLNSWINDVSKAIWLFDSYAVPHTAEAIWLSSILRPFSKIQLTWMANMDYKTLLQHEGHVVIMDRDEYSWLNNPILSPRQHISTILTPVFGKDRANKAVDFIMTETAKAYDKYIADYKLTSKMPYRLAGKVNEARSNSYLADMDRLNNRIANIEHDVISTYVSSIFKGTAINPIDTKELHNALVYAYAYYCIIGVPVLTQRGTVAFRKTGYQSSIIAIDGAVEALSGNIRPAFWPVSC